MILTEFPPGTIYMHQEIRISVVDIVVCADLRALLVSRGIDPTRDYNVRLSPDSEHYIYTRAVPIAEAHSHA